jgi:hypothetical protein
MLKTPPKPHKEKKDASTSPKDEQRSANVSTNRAKEKRRQE